MQVTIIVQRNGETKGKSYPLHEMGKSKKGTYKTFSPAGETADLPSFGKVYVKAKREEKKQKSTKPLVSVTL